MSTGTSNTGTATLPAAGAHPTARLLPPAAKRSLAEHLEWFGDLPAAGPALLG